MVIDERRLEGFDRTVTLEFVDNKTVQVSITDSIGVVEWARNTEDRKVAVDMFKHPFAFGYQACNSDTELPCGSS